MSEEMTLSNERLAEMLVWCETRKADKPWYGEGDDSPKMVTTCDFMVSIITELQALRASSGVEVKGLEWFVIDETWERAQTLFGLTYDATNRGWYNTVSRFVPCTDLKQSKAAAEADHRQRILSCLSSPLPTVEVTGALIDAGAHALEHGADLSLSWEEFCTVSELVLRSALSQNKGEE